MSQTETSNPESTHSDTTTKRRRGAPDWWLMFKKFLKHGKTIASVAPSSRFLIKALLKDLDFANAKVIVELGAGTGPITSVLVRKMNPDCRLLIIERDIDFVNTLKERFPNHEVIHADAADLEKVLDERGIKEVDHVVSGLPLPSIPTPYREAIIDAVNRRLAPNGTLRQITVIPYVFLKFYRTHFDGVKFELVTLNVPPGGAYTASPRKLPQKG
jgi:phospholipid N-methyltransferase